MIGEISSATTYRNPNVQLAALIKEVTESSTKATLTAEKSVIVTDLDDNKITTAATAIAKDPDVLAVW